VQKIKKVMGSLDRDTVARTCKQLRTRIEAVVQANGDFIEEIHSHDFIEEIHSQNIFISFFPQ
jgi:hypothetical protein